MVEFTSKKGLAIAAVALFAPLTTATETNEALSASFDTNRTISNSCQRWPVQECARRLQQIGHLPCVVDKSKDYPPDFCEQFEDLRGLVNIWGTGPEHYTQNSCGYVAKAILTILKRCHVDMGPGIGHIVGGYDYTPGNGDFRVTVRPGGPFPWDDRVGGGDIFCVCEELHGTRICPDIPENEHTPYTYTEKIPAPPTPPTTTLLFGTNSASG